MTARAPAARGKQDRNQKAIADAIRLLGYPVMDLSHAGNGVEDLLTGLTRRLVNGHIQTYWLVVECKVPPVKFTKRQREWREITASWPRVTVTSAQDAVDQIRRLTE